MNCGLAVYTLISDVGLQGGASYFLLCWHLGGRGWVGMYNTVHESVLCIIFEVRQVSKRLQR